MDNKNLLEKRLEVMMGLFGPNAATPDFGRYTLQGASVKSVSLLPDRGLRFSLVAGVRLRSYTLTPETETPQQRRV